MLGFSEHFLQSLAVTCRFDRRTDVAGDQFQQVDVAIGQWPQKAQFNHTVDPIVVAGRHHQHAVRQTFAKTRADLEVIGRHRVETNQARLLGNLPGDTFATVDHLFLVFLLTGKAVSGDAFETTVFFTHIQRRDGASQVLRTELQNIAAQQIQRELPQHLLGQLRLPVAQPGLALQTLGAGLLCRQGGG